MTQSDLIKELKNAVTPSEWDLLKGEDYHRLVISDFNRDVLCRMMDMKTDSDVPVNDSDVKALRTLLEQYLQNHMKEQDFAHKWIIIACLYLTFIEHKPMHPLDAVGILVSEADGKVIYSCPLKECKEGSVCNYCVSRKLS